MSLATATRVWAKIGLLSFGGPAGQIALMHRILVDEKRWVSERRFLHALNFCMLLPGPEAQQLASYVGWMLHGIRGGLIAGSLFILPGFVVILGLSYLYASAGTLPLVEGIFLGLKPAVIVIVLQAVLRIGRRSLRSAWLVVLAASAFVAMFVFKVPFPYVVVFAGLSGWLTARWRGAHGAKTRAGTIASRANTGLAYMVRCLVSFGALWIVPTLALVVTLGPQHVYSNIAVFFSKMAVVTFGGAYAVLSYVSQEAVTVHAWLAPGEMIDGLAMAETTPGPLIMVVQFVGFMAAYRNPGDLSPELAALLGSLLTIWVTFVPCFLWIFAGAPHVERLRRSGPLSGALAAVTAAVVGVIVNLALWFSMHALFGEVTRIGAAGMNLELPVLASLRVAPILITAVAAVLVFRLRASILATLGTTSVLGVAAQLL